MERIEEKLWRRPKSVCAFALSTRRRIACCSSATWLVAWRKRANSARHPVSHSELEREEITGSTLHGGGHHALTGACEIGARNLRQAGEFVAGLMAGIHTRKKLHVRITETPVSNF